MRAPAERSARTRAQCLGDRAEDAVAARLVAAGWRILARQVRVGRGELDILATDPGPPAALVAVEVRWRRSREFGLPEETVDHRKVAHLRAALGQLLAAGTLPDGTPLPGDPARIDLVVVEPRAVRHHQGVW
jgi:Holliday junction resolvase-like predicted endonuclease